MSTLENIIEHGNRPPLNLDFRNAGVGIERAENDITCVDGFTLSVIAGDGTYCSPRPSSMGTPFIGEVDGAYKGPFDLVEVGFPSVRPEPWSEWEGLAENADHPTETVYGYVAVQMVRDLIELHGGESA